MSNPKENEPYKNRQEFMADRVRMALESGQKFVDYKKVQGYETGKGNVYEKSVYGENRAESISPIANSSTDYDPGIIYHSDEDK